MISKQVRRKRRRNEGDYGQEKVVQKHNNDLPKIFHTLIPYICGNAILCDKRDFVDIIMIMNLEMQRSSWITW